MRSPTALGHEATGLDAVDRGEQRHRGRSARGRRLGLLVAGMALVAGTLATTATPASAARSNNKTKPVIFVHGYDPGGAGHDCSKYWGNAMADLRGQGFTNTFYTWGYYAADTLCSTKWGGTRGSSLDSVATAFAWYVFDNFTRQGRVVDVVAHSMGGLVVRKAISAVHRGEPGYPGWLYIEDAVTLGTPHGSIGLGWGCVAISALRTRQCLDVATFSPFMNSLVADAQNPQGANGGTDWSLIGSSADELVGNTPLDMVAGHKYLFDQLSHTSMINVRSTSTQRFTVKWWHTWPTVRSGTSGAERSALYVAGQALAYDSW